MNNMNIGGTELGSEDEIADSDDDGRLKLFNSVQINSIVSRRTENNYKYGRLLFLFLCF